MPTLLWIFALLAVPVLVGLFLALNKQPPKIFISYRRTDTQAIAGRLQADLARHFGAKSLFRDVNSIKYFEELHKSLEEEVAGSAVFLPLIGHGWGGVDETGESRLDDPRDFVRLEVENALEYRPAVLPLLVDRAPMPRQKDLPKSLWGLRAFPARELRDESWRADTASLMEAIEGQMGNPKRHRQRILALCLSAIVLLVAPAVYWNLNSAWNVQTLRRGEIPADALKAVIRLDALGGCDAKCLRQHLVVREEHFANKTKRGLDLWATGRPLALGWLELPKSERAETIIRIVRALVPGSTTANQLGELLAVLDEVVGQRYYDEERRWHDDYMATRQMVMDQLIENFGSPSPLDALWCDIPIQHRRIQIGCFAECDPTCLFKQPNVSLENSRDEEPRYFDLRPSFRLMCEEVTLDQYRGFDSRHQQEDSDGDIPVRDVNWFEAYAFASWHGYRLPSEAEWEHAARAGCRGPLWSTCPGTASEPRCTSAAEIDDAMSTLGEVAHYIGNSDNAVRASGQGAANPNGLKNIHGNVAEWCLEWYPDGEPKRADTGVLYGYKITRGGSYLHSEEGIRLSHVHAELPYQRLNWVGFRLAH